MHGPGAAGVEQRTARASTSRDPTLSRVAKVLARPAAGCRGSPRAGRAARRRRSGRRRGGSARSSATSSAVAEDSTAADGSRAARWLPAPRCPRPAARATTTSVATRSASVDGTDVGVSAVTTTTLGTHSTPSRSSARGPDREITGACSRTNCRIAVRSVWSARDATTPAAGELGLASSGRPRPSSSRSCSRRRNSLVLWVSVASWTRSPGGPGPSRCTDRLEVELAADRDRLVADVHRAVRTRTSWSSGMAASPCADVVDEITPASASTSGPRLRSGRRSSARR